MVGFSTKLLISRIVLRDNATRELEQPRRWQRQKLENKKPNRFRPCPSFVSPLVSLLVIQTKIAEGPRVPKQSERTKQISQQTYDHPVYREISFTNGQINKMKKEEVKLCLAERGLDSRGVKEVLQKRLKNHIKKEKLIQTKRAPRWEETLINVTRYR